jgi:hypothetical protein
MFRGLIFGGLIFGWAYIRGEGAYIWNEVSVSICGGLIFGGGGLYSGAYSRRFTVVHSMQIFNDSHYSNLYAGLLA